MCGDKRAEGEQGGSDRTLRPQPSGGELGPSRAPHLCVGRPPARSWHGQPPPHGGWRLTGLCLWEGQRVCELCGTARPGSLELRSPRCLTALPVPLSGIHPTAQALLGTDPAPCSPAPTPARSLRGPTRGPVCANGEVSGSGQKRGPRWGDPGRESIPLAPGTHESSKCSSRVWGPASPVPPAVSPGSLHTGSRAPTTTGAESRAGLRSCCRLRSRFRGRQVGTEGRA